MKRWQSILIQSILTAGQVVNIGMESGKLPQVAPNAATPYIALGLGILQTILANKAHNSNPDGTPASVAYRTESQKLIDQIR